MIHAFTPWLRRGAFAVAALAILAGVPHRSQALPLVGVYEKNSFEFIVNLGDSASLNTLNYNANISQFGNTTAGAQFTIVSVLSRTFTDSSGAAFLGNVVYTKTGTAPDASALTDNGVTQAQNFVAGAGTADSWFDLITNVINGGAGFNIVLASNAANSFETKVDNTFFGNFPFSTAGTIDGSGILSTTLYSSVASDLFSGAPLTVTKIMDLGVTSTGIHKVTPAPEPASLVLIGAALGAVAALRRRAA